MNTLIHYYNDTASLFKTITMYNKDEITEITDAISSTGSWYGGRFSASDRDSYMLRRYSVEELLYKEFTAQFGALKSNTPVYFYLIPNLDQAYIDAHLEARKQFAEDSTQYLILDFDKLPDHSNISFTINDSFRSYRTKLIEKGIPVRQIVNLFSELEDYGKVFPMDDINRIHSKYKDVDDIRYEVQIWDPDILEDIRRKYSKQ